MGRNPAGDFEARNRGVEPNSSGGFARIGEFRWWLKDEELEEMREDVEP